jgi:YfiH family protein
VIEPKWAAPPRVRALVTTRAEGDVSQTAVRETLLRQLPAEPSWLRQVHGTNVLEVPSKTSRPDADASFTRRTEAVCAVMMADCMPVLFCDDAGTTVAAAHAGWRGLGAGVLEATIDALKVEPRKLMAWLGPAIGPKAYEVGADVRAAYAGFESAFTPTRPGHWLLDLYAVARQRLNAAGVSRVDGGGFCTYSEAERFFSFRRNKTAERMAALIWLT